MSLSSRSSYVPHRRLNSVQSLQSNQSFQKNGRRSRAMSRGRQVAVSHDDAYSFALRVVYLHHLLQPRKKKREYIAAPKRAAVIRSNTNITDLLKDAVKGSSSSTKLPSKFHVALAKRMSGVMQGTEKMGGYNDRIIKLTFAEAYTIFTSEVFRNNEKDRKIEPYILMFYSSATKALAKDPETQKKPLEDKQLMEDRHLAMFLRLVVAILKDTGYEKDRADLISHLSTLETKLLRHEQNLVDTGQRGEHTYVEVDIPPSTLLQDMRMAQIVAKIFGVSNTQVEKDIHSHMAAWTLEAALLDYKTYQHRLAAGTGGSLQSDDFDLEESFEEWKKNEGPHLGQIFAEILMVRPELRSTVTGGDKGQPFRPTSQYVDEQAFAELSRKLDAADFGAEASAQGDESSNSSIRTVVDEPSYRFIPRDPRAFYKTILQYAMSFDLLYLDHTQGYRPLSGESLELMTELAVRWRIPQFTRHISLVEVAARKFIDLEISTEQLDQCLSFVKEPLPECKKAPLIQMNALTLPDIPSALWTRMDYNGYKQSLKDLDDALLRKLMTLMMQCYEDKPPQIGAVMYILENHIENDAIYSERPQDMADYAQHLESGLREQAVDAYRRCLNKHIPESQDDWDFGHISRLGKAVVGLCEKLKKRYSKRPEVMGVSPYKVLVETMFPSFEEDAKEFIRRVIMVARERKEEVHQQDGFILYKELVAIRKIHFECLPRKLFAFDIESLLEEFVWSYIHSASERLESFVENSVRQDRFQVRGANADGLAADNQRHSTSIMDTFKLFDDTIKLVRDLEWDDEIHLARFMTALSKAFAASIRRYCEMVEAIFKKEMDRQTSQEMAAASQTTQDRLLQYARDAWNSKEKIEPFQFYPESFVKLNNIEFALQQLDRLQKDVDVDRWAEVLARVDGPKRLGKKPSKYVFTVKIVEAEDIKACDPSGTSDPYVVLCDEYQKRLVKTRIVYKTLNPRWNESVDVAVTGPLNIIATIWDHDTFGEDDFVGRTSLKLDPKLFGDYLPREFWLDLDTQGRILLRVSMEGETDDIHFYFAKAFRHLKRTERDMVRSITDKLTAYISTCLSREALRSLLSKSLAASMASLWKKRQSPAPALTAADVSNAMEPLFAYFNDNFEIMKLTLTDATMTHVMARLWKEVQLAIEALLIPPLSEKLSTQKPLTQVEVDVVYKWLDLLYDFFLARDDETGEVQGVPADVLRNNKWHDLMSLNYHYFETTEELIRHSEGMAKTTLVRNQEQLELVRKNAANANRLSAPATFGATLAPFGSLGTIRRGKSIMMSRNLGTMRRAKEEKRKEAQADPTDDMVLRILRMRPEAAGYLKERHRQKERQAASQAAAIIVRQSLSQGWANCGPAFGGALYGRSVAPPRR